MYIYIYTTCTYTYHLYVLNFGRLHTIILARTLVHELQNTAPYLFNEHPWGQPMGYQFKNQRGSKHPTAGMSSKAIFQPFTYREILKGSTWVASRAPVVSTAIWRDLIRINLAFLALVFCRKITTGRSKPTKTE